MSELSPKIGESPEALQHDRRLATVRRLRLQSLEHDLAFQRVLDLMVSQLSPCGAGISISTPRVAMIKAGFNFRIGDHDPEGSIIDWPLRLGRPLMVSDAAADSHLSQTREVQGPLRMRYFVGAPFHAPNGVPVGTLFAYDQAPRFRRQSDLQLLSDLQRQLEDVLLIREHERLDLMTRLLTPQNFVERYLRSWRSAARAAESMSIAVFRLDGLQQINQTLDRAAGDTAVLRFADLIRDHAAGGEGQTGRLAGNLFAAAYAPGTPPSRIEHHCETLRWAFRDITKALGKGAYRKLDVSVCISTTAGNHHLEMQPLEALRLAEAGLPDAESAGEIRVQLARQAAQRVSDLCAPATAEIERNLSPWPRSGRAL